MSHHVTCHVTVMSHASSSSLKGKRKRNIKSRKIDKRKRKMLVSKVFYNILEPRSTICVILLPVSSNTYTTKLILLLLSFILIFTDNPSKYKSLLTLYYYIDILVSLISLEIV